MLWTEKSKNVFSTKPAGLTALKTSHTIKKIFFDKRMQNQTKNYVQNELTFTVLSKYLLPTCYLIVVIWPVFFLFGKGWINILSHTYQDWFVIMHTRRLTYVCVCSYNWKFGSYIQSTDRQNVYKMTEYFDFIWPLAIANMN
jgi:hypothetical protein